MVHAKKLIGKVSGGKANQPLTITAYALQYAPHMKKTQLRNITVSAGAYYFSVWITAPLAWGFWNLLSRTAHTYPGDFAGKILMPLMIHLPAAVIGVGVGALVVWLVESQTPVRWAALPAALFAYFGYTGHHWAIQPSPMDRIGQVIGALFPALTCIGSAIVATRRQERTKPHEPV